MAVVGCWRSIPGCWAGGVRLGKVRDLLVRVSGKPQMREMEREFVEQEEPQLIAEFGIGRRLSESDFESDY